MRKLFTGLVLIALVSTAGCGSGGADAAPVATGGFNLDLGGYFDDIPETYGAASGQTGPWVPVRDGTTNAITNAAGDVTAVSIVLDGISSVANPRTSTEGDLLRDWMESPAAPEDGLSVTLTGLDDGLYALYYYVPRPTDDFTANGGPMPGLPGGDLNGLGAQGTNWNTVLVSVSGGTLTITGSPFNAYLSGVQIVPVR
ncbi:MAG: hypothetical protein QNJ98_05770 [Planctomycetota bacterium]|nr:hypothetical protein [Planctomycetota bacterium]